MISNIVYISLLIISGSVSTAMLFHLWINRKVLNPGFFLVMVIAGWFWVTTQIGESIFRNIAVKIFMHNVQDIGVVYLLSAWLSFSIEFVELKVKQSFNRILFIILGSLPTLLMLVLLFTGNEQLFWGKPTLSPNNLLLIESFGLLYPYFLLYVLLLLGCGIVILLQESLKKGIIELRRRLPIIIAVFSPLGAYTVDLFFYKELFYYDTIPIVLSISSLAVIYFTRLRYFRTIPLTQHIVIESMNDTVIILSPENRIIYINKAGYNSFAIFSITDIGKSIETISPELTGLIIKSGSEQSYSDEIKLNNNFFGVNISTIRNWKKTLTCRVLVLRDISKLKSIENSLREMKQQLEVRVQERTKELKETNTALIDEILERTKAEKIIKESLDEKNILLGELHHRVKNNLQIISSLLNLQSHYITDKKAKEVFDISVARIRSIALIHEKLYRSDNLSHTNFAEYIHELAYYIITSQSRFGENIELDLAVDEKYLSINRSILCGLIINELLTNALKHAFPKGKKTSQKKPKRIAIKFTASDDNYILAISDNGRGIPPDYREGKETSLGLKIISTLVKQLRGSIAFNYSEGTAATIMFPLRE